MTYPIVLHDRAKLFLIESYEWWAENRSLEQAERWWDGFHSALDSLRQNPSRCPVALDCKDFPFKVRELRFGLENKPTHRAIFAIRPDMVFIFLVRHLAQRDVTLDDIQPGSCQK